ncbi:DnaB-like helicase C-terminal domain-containing protein [Pirellulales bacterium]|nr:DnaB-like helicase C-terminal domain-containing protein [Pirellulales bacterium]
MHSTVDHAPPPANGFANTDRGITPAAKANGLPAAPESEAAIVVDCIVAPELLPEVAKRISPRDFFDTQHGEAYRALLAMQRDGTPITAPLLRDRLSGRAAFSGQTSAAVYIAELIREFATTAHLKYHATRIAEASVKRQLYLALHDAAIAVGEGHPAPSVVSDLRSTLDDLSRDDDVPTTEATFDDWARRVVERERPETFTIAPAGSRLGEVFAVAGGSVTLLGAPPAAGKTALVGQCVIHALDAPGQQELRVMFCNVEMSPGALLDRELARRARVGHTYIRHRDYDVTASHRIDVAIRQLRGVMPRVEFMAAPFTIERIAQRAEAHAADIVVIDYLQRIHCEGETDARMRTNRVMDGARRLAAEGRAVIVVSAVSRGRGKNGSDYGSESLGLASFRESSELEYGADSAYLLVKLDDARCELRCVKNRHGALGKAELRFNGNFQEFTDAACDDSGGIPWK